MPKGFRWRPTQRQTLVVLGLILAVTLIIAGYWMPWTGFDRFPTNAGPDNLPAHRERTVWDWMQLLIVPVMIALGGFWLNSAEKERERIRSEQRAESERARDEVQAEIEHIRAEERTRTERWINEERLQEEAIQTYFDRMETLLLDRGLSKPEPELEVLTLARARTLTVLRRLDNDRKGQILLFLYDANLIDVGNSKVELREADLGGAELPLAFLENANLDMALLYEANLSYANLAGANLSSTDLEGTDLSNADLSGANLLFAILSDVTDFTGAVYDSQTRWPEGFDYVAAGARQLEVQPSSTRPSPVGEVIRQENEA